MLLLLLDLVLLVILIPFDTEWDLFKYDGLHPNKKGTKKLISNCINFIAFSLK